MVLDDDQLRAALLKTCQEPGLARSSPCRSPTSSSALAPCWSVAARAARGASSRSARARGEPWTGTYRSGGPDRLADTPALWLGDRGKELSYFGLHAALKARRPGAPCRGAFCLPGAGAGGSACSLRSPVNLGLQDRMHMRHSAYNVHTCCRRSARQEGEKWRHQVLAGALEVPRLTGTGPSNHEGKAGRAVRGLRGLAPTGAGVVTVVMRCG